MLIRAIVLAAVAVTALLFLFSRLVTTPHRFEERFHADKIAGPQFAKPVPTVRIIPLPSAPPPQIPPEKAPPPPVAAPPVTLPPAAVIRPDPVETRPAPPARRKTRAERRDERRAKRDARSMGGDICERHGRRKVYTDNGRSWRCKK